jgi:hypothetical protein
LFCGSMLIDMIDNDVEIINLEDIAENLDFEDS